MNLNKLRNGWVKGLSVFTLAFLAGCDPDPNPVVDGSASFESQPQAFPIEKGVIDEASGLAPALSLSGYLWTHQDSGQPNAVYLLSQDGKTAKKYTVPGAVNRDWEDMATGPGPMDGTNYLYIADIGNNNTPVQDEVVIYRVPEISSVDGSFQTAEKIRFKYPDGTRDAETILVDPLTKDIFVLTKEMTTAVLYRLPYPQSLTDVITAERVGVVPSVLFATGGSVSPNGKEILIRTYFAAYYWSRGDSQAIGQLLLTKPTKELKIASEPQGEGICFDKENKGFYTISEKGSAASVSLNFYQRK